MKFTAVLSLVTLVAGALAVPQMTRDEIIASRAGMGGVEARDEISSLESRACPTSSCDCVGVSAGLFCGDGKYNCKKGYVYQCSGGSRSCVFGKRDSCRKCNQLSC